MSYHSRRRNHLTQTYAAHLIKTCRPKSCPLAIKANCFTFPTLVRECQGCGFGPRYASDMCTHTLTHTHTRAQRRAPTSASKQPCPHHRSTMCALETSLAPDPCRCAQALARRQSLPSRTLPHLDISHWCSQSNLCTLGLNFHRRRSCAKASAARPWTTQSTHPPTHTHTDRDHTHTHTHALFKSGCIFHTHTTQANHPIPLQEHSVPLSYCSGHCERDSLHSAAFASTPIPE